MMKRVLILSGALLIIGAGSPSSAGADEPTELSRSSGSQTQTRENSLLTQDDVAKFLSLNREVQILRAERLVETNPKSRGARQALVAAKKQPFKAGPLVPSGVGQFGYWPEPRVQSERSLGGGAYLARIGIADCIVRGVPPVPGKRILVVTGYKTIRRTGVRTTKTDLTGGALESKAYDEQYDVPVVEVLDVKAAIQMLEKQLAELQSQQGDC